MPLTRRDLFIRMFKRTMDEAPAALPTPVKNFLGIETKPAASTPEQAAFLLARRNKRNTSIKTGVPGRTPEK